MTRLFERIAADELALGAYVKGGPHLAFTLAKAGFDYIRPDMMFSSIDWKELDHILRASDSVGLTTCLRIASNPWLAGPGQMQVTVDAARAFSLGVPVVQVSVASAAQVAALVDVAKDWHRSGAGEYPTTGDTFTAQRKRVIDQTLFLPSIESKTAIDELDDILSIEGLRAVMIAVTDFSKELGHAFEYEHPEVWRAIDRVVETARAKGILVAANTGYAYTTPETITKRVADLYDHGVRMVMIQGAEFLLECLAKPLLGGIRERTA